MCHIPPLWLEIFVTGNWDQLEPIGKNLGTIWEQFKNLLCTKRDHQNFLPNAILKGKFDRQSIRSGWTDGRADARTDALKQKKVSENMCQ